MKSRQKKHTKFFFSNLEFGPKTGRACNDLAWNPKYTNYLAAAYEKNRNDSSILIFDTSLKTSANVVVDSASTSAMSKIVPNRCDDAHLFNYQ